MSYKIVNKNGKKVFDENYSSKKAATRDIIYTIRGAGTTEAAVKTYNNLKIQKNPKKAKK